MKTNRGSIVEVGREVIKSVIGFILLKKKVWVNNIVGEQVEA